MKMGGQFKWKTGGQLQYYFAYLTIDFIIDGDTLKAIYKFNNNFYICSINIKSKELLSNFILLNENLDANTSLIQPKFISKNQLFFITHDKVFIKINLLK